MELTGTEKIVLRLVAQDGDYERLEVLAQELCDYMPSTLNEKVIPAARSAIEKLVASDLISLYTETSEGQSDRVSRNLIPKDEVPTAIAGKEVWQPRHTARIRISAAPTQSGTRVYHAFKDDPTQSGG